MSGLKRHKFTVDKDYVCKDCCHTEQFVVFGKTFNTYHEACRNKYVVSKLKCGCCGAKLEKSSHHYWMRELAKNPEKELICKPCSDFNKCSNINANQINNLYAKFIKVKWLLDEYEKYEGDYKSRIKKNQFAKQIIKTFKSKGIYCDRYVDYILRYCKITDNGNHHLYPKAVFGERDNQYIDCDVYTHSILHYLLLLDNFEHYKGSDEQKRVIQGLNVRYVFHKNCLDEVFSEQLIKRLKYIYDN